MSAYQKCLEKARSENTQNSVLINQYQGAVRYNISPNTFKKMATEAGARRAIGNRVLYSVEICDRLFEVR